MCLILFASQSHPEYPLVLAANRDEFYDRPTLPLQYWQDNPTILAGQDLKAGGTWLGVTKSGRLAALTNYREPITAKPDSPSRGELVKNFLAGTESAETYLRQVRKVANHYSGFNLLVGEQDALWYFSNRGAGVARVAPGVHGVSNHLMDTPWPKVTNGKFDLSRTLLADAIEEEALFRLLANRDFPPADQLPDTGVGATWERILSPRFITSAMYGTRSSSLILITTDLAVTFVERTFVYGTVDQTTPSTRRYRLDWASPPYKR